MLPGPQVPFANTNPNQVPSIGGDPSNGNYFNGKIDEVRVYKYARTSAQVAWDYNRGAPVAWYKFDECQGTVAHDSSNNRIDGTINPGDNTGSNDSVGTCNSSPADPINANEMWNVGTTGKFNSSLSFDGTNDNVSVTNPSVDDFGTGPMSVSAWVKTSTSDTSHDHEIVDNKTSDSNNAGFALKIYGADDVLGKATFRVANGVSFGEAASESKTYNDGNWHHLVGTLERGGPNDILRLYVDGRLINSKSITAGWNITSSQNLIFGAYGTGASNDNFDGLIDDVRLYNYALTATQIKTLVNENSAIRFGPASGSP